MVSAIFPAVDPFGYNAFSLATTIREILRNQTVAMSTPGDAAYADVPGLGFTTFSPATALMDLIDVTSGALPVAFVACVGVSFGLVAFWFGAVFTPLKSIMTVVVPITWTYGAA